MFHRFNIIWQIQIFISMIIQSYFPQKLMQRPQFKKIYNQNIWEIDLQNICKKKTKERTKFDRNALAHWISQVPMMSSYAFHIIDSICSKIMIKQFKRGQSIIDGDDSNAPLYIVYEGKVLVLTFDSYCFNSSEYNYLINETMTASFLQTESPSWFQKTPLDAIYTIETTQQEIISLFLFKKLFVLCLVMLTTKPQFSASRRQMLCHSQTSLKMQHFLNNGNITSFKHFVEVYTLRTIKKEMVQQYYYYNVLIIIVVYQQDFPPDNFYIVRSGKFKVQKFVNLDTQNVWPRGVREWEVSKVKRTLSHKINILETRRFVGEREILMKRDRQVTITADSDNCSMLCMNRTIFKKCMTIHLILSQTIFMLVLNSQDRKTLLSIEDNMFPTQQQLIMKLTVQNKLKKFKNTAVLNAANTNYHPLGARDFYIQKQRKKLIPWLQGYQDRMRKAKDKFKMANKIQQNSVMIQQQPLFLFSVQPNLTTMGIRKRLSIRIFKFKRFIQELPS